jgi:hypothetical protein
MGCAGRGESGGGIGFVVSRGDLVRRSGATVGPFIGLVTKLVDKDGEPAVGAEAREPCVELGSRETPKMDSEVDADASPGMDCNIGGEGFDRDRRSLSIDPEEDTWVESKEEIDCALEGGLAEFDGDVGIEFIEVDEVDIGLVLDEACPEPDEGGTATFDKDESSLSRQSSASENMVEEALDVDAAE